MNDKKRALIEKLANDLLDKEQACRRLGMLNTYGKSPEELKKQHAEFRVAEAEMFETKAALRSAQEDI